MKWREWSGTQEGKDQRKVHGEGGGAGRGVSYGRQRGEGEQSGWVGWRVAGISLSQHSTVLKLTFL